MFESEAMQFVMIVCNITATILRLEFRDVDPVWQK